MQRLQKFSEVTGVASRHLRQLNNNNQPIEITEHKTGKQETGGGGGGGGQAIFLKHALDPLRCIVGAGKLQTSEEHSQENKNMIQPSKLHRRVQCGYEVAAG